MQGLPYKYVVAVDSRGFSEAPSAIMNALNHLTWAGKDAIKDGSYRPFNELLCLGYMEKQEIGVSLSNVCCYQNFPPKLTKSSGTMTVKRTLAPMSHLGRWVVPQS